MEEQLVDKVMVVEETPPRSTSTESSVRMKQKPKQKDIKQYMTRITPAEKKWDLKVAKFVYATNSPFMIVGHDTFKDLAGSLRPGYTPPDRHRDGGVLLNKVYGEVRENVKKELDNQKV